MEVCQECGSTDVEYSNNGVACRTCGNIIDSFVTGRTAELEGRLITDLHTETFAGHAPGSKTKAVLDKQRAIERDVVGMLASLQLRQPHLKARVLEIYKLARSKQAVGSAGVVSRVLVGAAACIAAREEGIPVLLADVADLLDCSRFKFGAALKRVLDDTKLPLPEPDIHAYMSWAAWKLLSDNPRREEVNKAARKHLAWMQAVDFNDSLPTPFCLAACALTLACEGLQVQCSDEQIAGVFRLHFRTVRKGCSLARRHLLDLAAQFPWYARLTEKTVATRALHLIQADAMRRSARANKQQAAESASPASHDGPLQSKKQCTREVPQPRLAKKHKASGTDE